MSDGGGVKIGGDFLDPKKNPLGFSMAAPNLGGLGLESIGNAVNDFGKSIGNIFAKPENKTPVIAGETDLEAALKSQLSGSDPSVAEKQLQRGVDLANKNAMAISAAQRGISPGLSSKLAFDQQQKNQMEANSQAGLMRAQEQLNAQNLLAQLYASQRGSQLATNQLNQQGSQFQQQLLMNAISGAGQAAMTAAMAGGGKVPGKASVKGDSPRNDTVPAMLSPGEIVIPRSVVKKGPDAISAFAKAILEKE